MLHILALLFASLIPAQARPYLPPYFPGLDFIGSPVCNGQSIPGSPYPEPFDGVDARMFGNDLKDVPSDIAGAIVGKAVR